jgi:hypothetical protein
MDVFLTATDLQFFRAQCHYCKAFYEGSFSISKTSNSLMVKGHDYKEDD